MLEVKKGDTVLIKVFTGMVACRAEVDSVSKKTFTVQAKNGKELVFDKKTGKQVNVEEGKEQYANTAVEDDGSFTPPTHGGKKKSKKAAAKPTKSKKPEPEDDEEENDEEEEETPKKSKKSKKHDDDEDDDDFEEVDD